MDMMVDESSGGGEGEILVHHQAQERGQGQGQERGQEQEQAKGEPFPPEKFSVNLEIKRVDYAAGATLRSYLRLLPYRVVAGRPGAETPNCTLILRNVAALLAHLCGADVSRDQWLPLAADRRQQLVEHILSWTGALQETTAVHHPREARRRQLQLALSATFGAPTSTPLTEIYDRSAAFT